jgi:hypothetical protein
MTERGQVSFPSGSGRSPASVHRIVRRFRFCHGVVRMNELAMVQQSFKPIVNDDIRFRQEADKAI